MSIFSKPAIHENFFCPNCRRLLPFGAERCKYCLEEIDSDYANLNAYIHFQLTQAVSHANIMATFDPAIAFFLIASLCLRWLKIEFYSDIPRLWLATELIFGLVWLAPVAASASWFYRYGKWRIIDEEEYQSKRRSMRLSLRMWLAAYAFHILLLLVVSVA